VGWLFYTIGLTIYDLLAGKLSLGSSKYIKEKTIELPTIEQKGLVNGVIYQDGQFDDSISHKYRTNRCRKGRLYFKLH
jgi:glycerol-3-phosphate dehydrogenase